MFLRRGIQSSLRLNPTRRFFVNTGVRAFSTGEDLTKKTIEGVWKTPGSKFDINCLNGVFVYSENLRSGASVSCPLKQKGSWFEGQLGPDWRVRFQLDQEQNVLRQNGSKAAWGKEVTGQLCYDSESDVEDSHEAFTKKSGAACAIGDTKCQEDMDWGAQDTGKYKRKRASTWRNPTQNHIWQKNELDKILDISINNPPEHAPTTVGDKAMFWFVKGLYRAFNFVTRFDPHNPTAKGCAWRVLFLESIAGVPGMVSACLRHFRSLRMLRRDHGWIHTLLEEAENERMHLLIAMKMFNAGPALRFCIIGGQYVFTSALVGVYIVSPQLLHRFVGYLEECAVSTYSMMIKVAETEGTMLNKEYKNLAAPAIAKGYYRLDDDATWVDTLRCILADESHHRDVNHVFASMKVDDPNPFVSRHLEDAYTAWQLNQPYRNQTDYNPMPLPTGDHFKSNPEYTDPLDKEWDQAKNKD